MRKIKTKIESIEKYTLIGHSFFILYLAFTIFYFKERLLNCDAAYYTFHVINYEEFFIKHQRFISYFTQWAPILVIKLGGSLKLALIAYSAVVGLWFYGLYIVATHLFKSPKGGILLALTLALTMRYKHYAGHTEITFALMVAALLIVYLCCNKDKIYWYTTAHDYTLKAIFIAWLYIIHPVIIIPLAVILAVDIIYHNR